MSTETAAPGVGHREDAVDAGALAVLRASLTAARLTVTGEPLLLPARSSEGRSATNVLEAPSARLDVAEHPHLRHPVTTAVRLYSGDGRALVHLTGDLANGAYEDPSVVGEGLRALLRDERREWADPASSYEASDLAVPSNADVERLLALASRTELAAVVNLPTEAWEWRTSRVGGLDADAVSTLGEVARVVGLEDDVTLLGFALAERVLTDLASGAPLEWALRRAAEATP